MATTTTPVAAKDIVAAARRIESHADAIELNQMIQASTGAAHRRPLGDIWNNFGLVSQAGDFDHKVIEAVTNAQDAVLERAAMARFPDGEVPYGSPREAAKDLLALDQRSVYDRINVEIRNSGAARHVTISVTDDGCGMTAAQMPETVLRLGSAHKSDSVYLQGAFGLGVKSTFRNARAAVVISRRAPEMGDGQDDRVAVAVVEWAEFGKGLGAYYLTTSEWGDGANPHAQPWSAPAGEVDFPVGTQLILVEYEVKGLHRKFSGDSRGFQAVADTRLHQPIIPFRQISHLVTKPEPRTVYGLAHQLAQRPPGPHGRDRLPFAINGTTYQLPIDWWVFPAASGAAGGRTSRVADGHVVSFTSSGQVHHHWDKPRFKAMTGFNKLDDRVYVVVETDELPITTRTRLFTPDRAALLPNDDAQRLESSLAAFLKDHEDLHEINGELQREAIESALGSRKTRAVAQRISQAFHAKGFSTGGGAGGGQTRNNNRRGKPKKLILRKEPTELSGPKTVTVRPEDVRSITFWLDARDAFLERKVGTFEVDCDHPDISAQELAIGDLHNGRVRVNVLVPEDPALGEYTLTATVPQWSSGSGGIAGPLRWETTLVVTDEPPAPRPEPNTTGGARGGGAEVALVWTDDAPRNVVGWVEDLEAQNLATRDEYKDLAKLGDHPIPTITLNNKYAELKRYLDAMRARKGDAAVEAAQGRYAAAVGVGLLVVRAEDKLEALDEEQLAGIARAHARTALSLLPDFDKLMAELDGD